jgi:hypothetical protein
MTVTQFDNYRRQAMHELQIVPVEHGYTHNSEQYFQAMFKDHRKETYAWLSELKTNLFDDTTSIEVFLYALSHFDHEINSSIDNELFDFVATMLKHPNIIIQDEAVSVLETWLMDIKSDTRPVELLKEFKTDVDWLQDYVLKILQEAEEAL